MNKVVVIFGNEFDTDKASVGTAVVLKKDHKFITSYTIVTPNGVGIAIPHKNVEGVLHCTANLPCPQFKEVAEANNGVRWEDVKHLSHEVKYVGEGLSDERAARVAEETLTAMMLADEDV